MAKTERFKIEVAPGLYRTWWAAATDRGDPIAEANRVTQVQAVCALRDKLRECIDDGKAAEKLLPLAEDKLEQLKQEESEDDGSREAEG